MIRTIVLACILLSGHFNCTSQVEFENLTKFERKIDKLEWKREYKKCNSYVDKHILKGKLNERELNFAYYVKCKLYGEMIYDFWGTNFDVFNKRASRIPDIYPYSETYPINQADTLIRYSKLFFQSADTSSLVYKMWWGFIYNDIYSMVGNGLDTLITSALESDEYYLSHKLECDNYFSRLDFLKQAVKHYHPVNQFDILLMEYRLKHSLGLLKEDEVSNLIELVTQFNHNRFDLRHHQAVIYWRDSFSGFTEIHGSEGFSLHQLLKNLYKHDRNLARRILKICPDDVTTVFASRNDFDTTWQIVQSSDLKQKRLFDLRDSVLYNSYTFPIYTSVEIEYNVPSEDTIVINKVECDIPQCQDVELLESLFLTGKGSTVATVVTYSRVPENDEVSNIEFRDIRLISNRGEREFEFRVNIIGQNRGDMTDSLKESQNKVFVQEDYPYYYEEVLQVTCDKNFGTDTLKIYQYPNNQVPIYTVVPSAKFEAPRQIHPLEVTSDSSYHFSLLAETENAYKVVYSNYHWDFEIGWIKKKDIDTGNIKLEEIVKTIDLTQFFEGCEYVHLRNPLQEIFAPDTFVASFSNRKLVPECKSFKYIAHRNELGEVPTMIVGPCENCTNTTLFEWGSAQLNWADGHYMLIEAINN